jgi:hypothetical protein
MHFLVEKDCEIQTLVEYLSMITLFLEMSLAFVCKRKLIYNHIMTKMTLLIGTVSHKY